MKLTILAESDSSILADITNLDLANYTILAGENNSGKTSLMRAIMNSPEVKSIYKENVIFIPAENIDPGTSVFKTSATTTEFSKLLKNILKPIISIWDMSALVKNFNVSKERKDLLNSVNDYLKKIGIEKKEIDIKIDPNGLKEDLIIKNLIVPIIIDSHGSRNIEISLDKIGSGTKRSIIAALLQFFGDLDTKEETLILFEEPEAYLHPKLKKGLHDNLLKLSADKNIKVVISTHDPYFIQLGNNSSVKIYEVFRDKKLNNSTQIIPIGKKYLNYNSYAEINYQIFHLPSETYFLEIYEETSRKENFNSENYTQFDNHMFTTYFSAKGLKQNCFDDKNPPRPITPMTRLRHNIAHGINSSPVMSLEDAIQNIINFIEKK